MVCPKCGAPNDDNAWKCVQCQTILQQAPQPVVIHPRVVIPNYLWQAIVCTACCCVPLGIPAIVYAAQVNSKVLQGDIAGARNSSKNAKMWCWIAFGSGLAFSVVYLLFVAAVAIPNLLRSRIAANQAAAVGSLRTLNTAGITYSSTYNMGFPPTIAALGPPVGGATPNANAAGLIDEVLASGTKSGYVFTYTPGEIDAQGRTITYTIHADPISSSTGTNHYFTDQTGVIRQESVGPANEQSPPIAG
jgi:type II secretory pathway pseudopilin PulG